MKVEGSIEQSEVLRHHNFTAIRLSINVCIVGDYTVDCMSLNKSKVVFDVPIVDKIHEFSTQQLIDELQRRTKG